MCLNSLIRCEWCFISHNHVEQVTVPLAMLHHGNVTYVRNAFNGVDCCRRCSFQKWNVCVKPFVVHRGL